jgi:hypothetical protein
MGSALMLRQTAIITTSTSSHERIDPPLDRMAFPGWSATCLMLSRQRPNKDLAIELPWQRLSIVGNQEQPSLCRRLRAPHFYPTLYPFIRKAATCNL